ncbi:sugar phosphate isomerase/epimerase [Myxococcota bacterium]|nr:sugar phosphate isomerase/epimerase [Myxococcota bacterium]
MLGTDDTVLCPGTLGPGTVFEHLEAAAVGEFEGVSLWALHYNAALQEGATGPEIAASANQLGLEVATLEAALLWADGPGKRTQADQETDGLLKTCEILNCQNLLATTLETRLPSLPDAIEGFARLCDQAAECDVRVSLEFLPWSGIPDLPTAWQIVQSCGRSNACLMIDGWHWFRTGGDTQLLRQIPGERIGGVQLCDAPAKPEGDLLEEAMHRRLLPGHGNADLMALIRCLDEIGSRAPLAVETFNDELMALPLNEASRRMHEALTTVRDAARTPAGRRQT